MVNPTSPAVNPPVNSEPNSTATPPGTQEAAQGPDFVRLASDLAGKHGARAPTAGAAGGSLGGKARGGRPTAAEEAQRYLDANGLVAVPADSAQDTPPAEPGPHYVVDPAFVQGCVTTLLKGVEAFRQRQVFLKVLRLSEDKPLAEEFANDAGAPPGAIEVMALCAAELSQKYDVLASASPEVMLIVAGASWFAKDFALVARLREIAKLSKPKPKPKDGPSPPPDKNPSDRG